MRLLLPLVLILAMLGVARAADRSAAPSSQPTDPQLWKEMSAVDAIAGRIKDVTADFRQQKFTPLLRKPLVSGGHVLGKAERTLWVTEKPEPTKMLVDASSISIYYPNQALEEIYPIEGQLGALASSPLPRIEVLRRFFSFERIPANSLDPGANDRDFLAVRMLPIDASLREHVQEVKVLLDRRSGFIVRAENTDADDERTVLTFSNAKVDTGLPDASLQLEIPSDVKVSHPLDSIEGSR